MVSQHVSGIQPLLAESATLLSVLLGWQYCLGGWKCQEEGDGHYNTCCGHLRCCFSAWTLRHGHGRDAFWGRTPLNDSVSGNKVGSKSCLVETMARFQK